MLNYFFIKKEKIILASIGIMLILFTGLKTPGFDLDSLLFIPHLTDKFSDINLLNKEPTFWLIQQINLAFFNGSHLSFFLFFAFLAISIKIIAIYQLSPYPVYSFFVYISYFYILQDLTQFRSGVAIALFFWSLVDVINKSILRFMIKMLIASMFHYSAALLIFIYFFSTSFDKKNLFVFFLLPFFGLILYKLNVVQEILPAIVGSIGGAFEYKFNLYVELLDNEKTEEVNVFSLGYIFIFILYYVSLFFVYFDKRSGLFKKVIVVSVKLFGLGLFVLYSASYIEAFSQRILMYLFFPFVVILPYLINRFNNNIFIHFVFFVFLLYTFIKTAILTLDFNYFL